MTTYKTFPPSTVCMSCFQPNGQHANDCLDFATVRIVPPGDALSWTGVMEAIQEPSEPRSAVPRVPVWTLAAIVCGSVLMAVGLLMNDPVSLWVWEATR